MNSPRSARMRRSAAWMRGAFCCDSPPERIVSASSATGASSTACQVGIARLQRLERAAGVEVAGVLAEEGQHQLVHRRIVRPPGRRRRRPPPTSADAPRRLRDLRSVVRPALQRKRSHAGARHRRSGQYRTEVRLQAVEGRSPIEPHPERVDTIIPHAYNSCNSPLCANLSAEGEPVMNHVYLSPHFPPNYYLFCTHLRRLGVNVLGVADEPYEWLRPEIKEALTEYYRVDDMHSYDQLVRACGYFTHRYGKIDRVDSHTEYWMELEARLRTDFNILGPKLADLRPYQAQVGDEEGVPRRQASPRHAAAWRRPRRGTTLGRRDRLSAGRQAGHRRGRRQHLQVGGCGRSRAVPVRPSRRSITCLRSSSTETSVHSTV